jgi:hypothetical protein
LKGIILKMETLKFFPSEIFKELDFKHRTRLRYAISNYGRLISFKDKMEDGRFMEGSRVSEYKIFKYKLYKEKEIIYESRLFHRMVAEAFLPNTDPEKNIVIHLNHNKTNNFADNLKWVSQAELTEHHNHNPNIIAARARNIKRSLIKDGHKLTSTEVKLIKKILANPERKTRKKMLAKRFNVSAMTISRIHSGENWGHVTPD